jgi:hypothetical protein
MITTPGGAVFFCKGRCPRPRVLHLLNDPGDKGHITRGEGEIDSRGSLTGLERGDRWGSAADNQSFASVALFRPGSLDGRTEGIWPISDLAYRQIG